MKCRENFKSLQLQSNNYFEKKIRQLRICSLTFQAELSSISGKVTEACEDAA